MYYIVNYRKNWNYGTEFTFKNARSKYNKVRDKDCIIEYYDKQYNRSIVWPKKKKAKLAS